MANWLTISSRAGVSNVAHRACSRFTGPPPRRVTAAVGRRPPCTASNWSPGTRRTTPPYGAPAEARPQQTVLLAPGVVVDSAQVPVGPVGEHGDDARARGHRARRPARDQRHGAHAPSARRMVPAGELTARPHRLGGGDPVHLVEGRVVHVRRMDARPQSAHQPGSGRLAEDRGADRVHADHPEAGGRLAKPGRDPGGVPPGPHGRDEHVDPAQLGGQLTGQRPVGHHVVRIGVLVGAVRARPGGQQFRDPLPPGLLPSTPRMRDVDPVDLRAEGAQQAHDGGLHPRVGHDRHGVTVGQPRQSQAEPERSTGGLHDRSTATEVPTTASPADHVQGGAVLDPAGVAALQLGEEPPAGLRERLVDPEQRGVADQLGRAPRHERGRGERDRGQGPGVVEQGRVMHEVAPPHR